MTVTTDHAGQGSLAGLSVVDLSTTLPGAQATQFLADAGADVILVEAPEGSPGVTMRRARRIDVWVTGPVIHVDAFFQDSSTLPEGGRQSIHEYTLTAEADLETGTVRAVTPEPRVLPYDECPLAVRNVPALAGTLLSELRGAVLERLRGPLGCTHLNDMLRALADVPELARHLPAAAGS